MVAARKIRKVRRLVRVVARESDLLEGLSGPLSGNRFAGRPSDLLPWADPYIARLVRNLQEEVRQEMA